ncbi:hypothetical protein [Caulobacter sp. SSI4214]|uniref:hypothetical protein n=1 Tax=Caulobacter sp. SSI4214 TaxID=2575739 RepID=UPI00143C5895|nr:hypothetical protein [Caulobacter sp. SSI4214]
MIVLPLIGLLAGPAAASAAQADARAAVVCVRAAPGPRPLNFSGELVGKRPQPGAFKLPLTPPGKDICNTLLRSKVAEWKLEVTTSGFTACELPPPEFGSRLYYRAKAAASGLKCEPIGKYPIGNWKP